MRFSERNALPGDVRALAEAEMECFSDPWPAPYFASELSAPGRYQRVLVDSAGGLVAYLFCAWQYLDLHVLKVATRPAFQRQGLARHLMASAERHARELLGESITLEVRASNDAARFMYLDLGFEVAGRRSGYYADGEDAIIMTSPLSGFGVTSTVANPSHPQDRL
jgi:ribosomal-protein-alanine N-acetyltransferase